MYVNKKGINKMAVEVLLVSTVSQLPSKVVVASLLYFPLYPHLCIIMDSSKIYRDIDAYIAEQPQGVRALLESIRQTIRQAAPEAEECISYQMPAFKFHGPLVYFAGYKNHIGFYPTPLPMAAFKEELTIYKTSKGAVQFPLDQPLPLELVTRMVQFMVHHNLEKAELKLLAKPKKKQAG